MLKYEDRNLKTIKNPIIYFEKWEHKSFFSVIIIFISKNSIKKLRNICINTYINIIDKIINIKKERIFDIKY